MTPHRRAPRPAVGTTQDDVRRHNLAAILGHLHLSGPLTRAELTARLGLNRSTIAGLVGELVALGALTEDRSAGAQGTAGRPSVLVSPREGGVQVLAVELGVDRLLLTLVGLGGTVLARRQRRLGARTSPAAVSGLLRRLCAELLESRRAGGPGPTRVVGLGVCVPGVVRPEDGFVRFAPNLGWTDEPFGDQLRAALADTLPGVVVHVGNDADLGVLAEHRRGVARGVDDVVFIAGDVGVGGGLVVGGHPLLGASGYAGELGHLKTRPGGAPCRCGARGCWETEIGAPAVAAALGLPAGAGVQAVVAALRAAAVDDPRLDGVAVALGTGLGGIVNLVNPQLVVLGGVLRELLPKARARVLQAMGAAALGPSVERVEVVVPALGGDAVVVGAAELAWGELLHDPVAVLGCQIEREPPGRPSGPRPRTAAGSSSSQRRTALS